jgi:phosphoglycolate phosphatase
MVNANLMKLGVQPNQAVVIGDTSFDMIMSKSAGVHAIGVNWGFHTDLEIRDGGADEIVSTMSDLGAALDSFARSGAAA